MENLLETTEQKDQFKIKLEVFEGPFDLLLHLIEEQKVDIYQVSINKITNAYIEYIHQMQTLDLEITSEFMVMAAILIELKSRSLLPSANPDNDDLLAEAEAEKQALLERLVEYKAFKNLTHELIQKEQQNLFIHTREQINQELFEQANQENNLVIKNASMDLLLKAFQRVWQDFEIRSMSHDFSHVSHTLISIKDRMKVIVDKLKRPHAKFSFFELFENTNNRYEIIATFIAILELTRQQFIVLAQSDLFDDIEITTRKDIQEKELNINDDEYNKIQGALE